LSEDGVSYLGMLVPYCRGLDLLRQVGQDCCEESVI
jgi:hypothetical protein